MNKMDFLRRLDKELGVLDKEERTELLDFYEERFHSGKIYENKTEEEIIADLESPETIARNILTEYGVNPKFVKTKEERYSGIDTTQLVILIIFDVLVTVWLVPTLFSVAFSLFASLISYIGAFPLILGSPTAMDINFFMLISAVYFLLFMFALVVLDFSILITKKIIVWHLNVFKYKNREKYIKKMNKTSIEGWVKKRRKLSIVKTLLVVGSFVVIFITGARLLFGEDNYLDAMINAPKLSDSYTKDVTTDITDSNTWKLTTDFDVMDIDIVEVPGNEIKIYHDYEEDYSFKISIDEDTNLINISNNRKVQFVTSFKSFLSLFGSRNQLTIEVPEGLDFTVVDIHTENGLVSISKIDTRALDIETYNGSVIVKNMVLNSNTSLKTYNGEVVIEDISIDGYKLVAETYNGDIRVKRTDFNSYELITYNGDVVLTDLNIVNKDGNAVVAESYNGEIELENVYILNIDLETYNGDIIYNNDDTSFQPTTYKKDTYNGGYEGNQN